MIKRLVYALSILFFIGAACFLFLPSSAMSAEITLNYANFPPAPTFPCVQMEDWKTKVEKRTDGQVEIKTFPGGTLLGAKGMMDGVIAGQADIGCLCMAYQPGRFIVTNALGLPLPVPDAKAGSLALLKLYEKYKPKAFDDVVVLTMFTTAPANIMSKVAVRNLDDIQGLDLRASGGAAQVLKAWGANPVGMPMSETPEALQKGTVKGLFSSLEVMKDFKFAEDCKYVTMTNTVLYPFAVVMNKDSWNSLPRDVQEVMMELKEEQSRWTGNYMDNQIKESIAWSKENHDVEIIELSESERAKWDKKLEFIKQDWIDNAKEKGLPAEQIIQDIESYIQ